ncbi:MAG: shikimate kinase [Actinomycetota bacterium]|nr:shikimate kinase [Actinomycetota bacterium]
MTPEPHRVGLRVCLVGMPGAGKSAVGRRVAALLGAPFHDLDSAVENALGMTVADCFARMGEGGFRRIESQKLAELLHAGGDLVLATGGGAVLDPASRLLMRNAATTVWLRVSIDTLAERTSRGRHRPLLARAGSGPAARLVLDRLAAERDPLYAEVAHVVLDAEGAEPGELALEVQAALSDLDAAARRGDPTNPAAGDRYRDRHAPNGPEETEGSEQRAWHG